MKFRVVQEGSEAAGNKKYFVKEMVTKAYLVLDTGDNMSFKHRQTAQDVCDSLNYEFGRKR